MSVHVFTLADWEKGPVIAETGTRGVVYIQSLSVQPHCGSLSAGQPGSTARAQANISRTWPG